MIQATLRSTLFDDDIATPNMSDDDSDYDDAVQAAEYLMHAQTVHELKSTFGQQVPDSKLTFKVVLCPMTDGTSSFLIGASKNYSFVSQERDCFSPTSCSTLSIPQRPCSVAHEISSP